ncbi:MAG: STAS domain-containing protein [Actinomycetota bacterium]|nr:STAS domain-containing protein [Actinomycetota bacterium]
MADSYRLSLGGLTVGWQHPDGGPARIHLQGELDNLSVPVLRQTVDALYARSCFEISVDLTELTFIDSSGLGALVAVWRRCQSEAGRAMVVNPSDAVRRLMDMTGIARFLIPAE